MRKLLLIIMAFMGVVFVSRAQEGFSVKAGYNSVNIDVDGFGSESEGGLFVGAGYNFVLDDKFDIEPSLLYSFVDDLNAIYIPVMGKYKVSEKFNIQAGPQVNWIVEDGEGDGKFGIDLAAGAGFNITEQFFAEARYGFEIIRDIDNVNINTFTIGLGYRFL
ncbi:porin family protein [Galbibacter sp. EGI 63066]|uniref:porin family protein n=1 Tax=Galbibacter sp. EGI 63066 TaxID=2993559 RepID=UPI0022493FFA|nr:porin family protein [Galbibacter sp. EGI 63066]MCX2681048.1 porin family protein [Galbibacter sp. EGI 63066]